VAALKQPLRLPRDASLAFLDQSGVLSTYALAIAASTVIETQVESFVTVPDGLAVSTRSQIAYAVSTRAFPGIYLTPLP